MSELGAIVPSSQGGVSCEKSNNTLAKERSDGRRTRWRKHPRQRDEYEIRSPRFDEGKGKGGEVSVRKRERED